MYHGFIERKKFSFPEFNPTHTFFYSFLIALSPERLYCKYKEANTAPQQKQEWWFKIMNFFIINSDFLK